MVNYSNHVHKNFNLGSICMESGPPSRFGTGSNFDPGVRSEVCSVQC